ncbi:hypothetical protein CISG_05223 [Coccidioides immitis RMSCC 3703]|uniref:Pheromone receptor PREB n=2 Tax=Coccidioides immitis TaxID=5501 RepID=A0A0J8QTN6_COCIT|nr:pheromone receptor PREB [Coccidioides immitis RMSCC 2394]KMU75826.1 hypothetical protein CISG_05223 [Coccidioides immitis RMSCC 3703]
MVDTSGFGNNFDPFTQPVRLYYPNGTDFHRSLAEIDWILRDNTNQSIAYGCQLGASLTMIIILLLLTPPGKRRSPVFMLNAAALVLNFGRILCSCIYYTTGFSDVYAMLAPDFSRVSVGAYANTFLGAILHALLLICVEISLLFQTHVLCSTIRSAYRRLALSFSVVLVLAAIGCRLMQTIENCRATINLKSFASFIWLQSLTNILTTVSICYFSTIFVAKLGFAIYARRTLGLTGFGAMQVMFIMSCQSMIVPARRLTHDLAIFSILHHFIDAAEMAPLVLTLVTLSLPLSSMWAAQAVKNSFEGDNRGPTQQRHLFTQGSSTAQTSMASTLVAKRTSSPDHLDRLYPDIDAIEIRVDRDFTVDIEKGQ